MPSTPTPKPNADQPVDPRAHPEQHEEIDLNEEEEAALDRAWARLGPQRIREREEAEKAAQGGQS
jgi:hypothetical protein